jgi:hypothetical protein
MRLALLLALLLVAAPAVAGIGPARPVDAALLSRAATQDEQLAESVAARLTGKRPIVRCGPLHTSAGVLGVTPFVGGRPAGYFLLDPQVCVDLAAFRGAPASWDPAACTANACMQRVSETVQAIQTISHESYHVLGWQSEATAECYGMQSIWYTANRLGASVPLAQSLAQFYWRHLYPIRRTSSHPEYWSAECRDGGKLDLRPKSHAWPS